jgi:hypothetical protein
MNLFHSSTSISFCIFKYQYNNNNNPRITITKESVLHTVDTWLNVYALISLYKKKWLKFPTVRNTSAQSIIINITRNIAMKCQTHDICTATDVRVSIAWIHRCSIWEFLHTLSLIGCFDARCVRWLWCPFVVWTTYVVCFCYICSTVCESYVTNAFCTVARERACAWWTTAVFACFHIVYITYM